MKQLLITLTLVLGTVAYSQEKTTIYLIRHGEKADTTADTELSDAGKKRSEKWAAYFKDKDIAHFYSTNYKRTKQTIQQAAGKETVHVYEHLNIDLRTIAKKHTGSNILIAGHSNTIPGYINKLLGGPVYADIPENEFGNLYIITITGNKVTHELVKP